VDNGSFANVDLKGLGVVAVIAARDTLGQEQTGPARSIVIVDRNASSEQRKALVRLARQQANGLLQDIVAVHAAPIDLFVADCKGGTCGRMRAGDMVHIETRCLDAEHDKACGNEGALYAPLAQAVKVQPAVASTHGFKGTDLNQTWRETDRRGAYVGSFAAR
jgi:hypothetical protein